jgi:hypothetical protein
MRFEESESDLPTITEKKKNVMTMTIHILDIILLCTRSVENLVQMASYGAQCGHTTVTTAAHIHVRDTVRTWVQRGGGGGRSINCYIYSIQ